MVPRVPRRPTTNRAFPQKSIARFRYVASVNIDAGVLGTPAGHEFSCNSCHDPDETAIGIQPSGWDQWVPFFSRYVVLKSKCTVTCAPREGTDNQTAFAIFLSPTASSVPASQTALANRLMAGNAAYGVYGAPHGRAPNLSLKFDARKYFGISDPADAVDTIGAATNASPSREVFYTVVLSCMGQSDPSQQQYFVTLDYLVMFFEPKILPDSS